MRKIALLLLASVAWFHTAPLGFAQVANPIINMPFVLGSVSIVASRCGLRDKLWATRLIGATQEAIRNLDWSVVTPQTGATADMLLDRLAEGQDNAISTLANDPGACAKLTPDRLSKIDDIVAGTTPVF